MEIKNEINNCLVLLLLIIIFIPHLNLTGLNSELVQILQFQNLSGFNLPEQFQSSHLIQSFNTRTITPFNINEIIDLCDFIGLKDTYSFIRNNIEYSSTPYCVNDCYSFRFNLPVNLCNYEISLRLGLIKVIAYHILQRLCPIRNPHHYGRLYNTLLN
jgi:hypothetical protein